VGSFAKKYSVLRKGIDVAKKGFKAALHMPLLRQFIGCFKSSKCMKHWKTKVLKDLGYDILGIMTSNLENYFSVLLNEY